jgi:putative CocE/NonD family hydrolase
VRIFTMGAGDGGTTVLGSPEDRAELAGRTTSGGYWRDEPDWPLPGTAFTPYYLHGDGSLSTDMPEASLARPFTGYVFDPRDPVPTMGGGISAANLMMRAGGFDQRGRPDFHGSKDTLPLNSRRDVLSFETPPLEEDTEATGPVEMRLWASSSEVDTDFTAKLLDVHPPGPAHPEGLAINITDSIIRARYRNGYDRPELMTPGQPYVLVFQLYPTSQVFRKGHRIRLDISSSNWPRFDVNPNTGGPLGRDREYRTATQAVYHDAERASHVVLPLQRRR